MRDVFTLSGSALPDPVRLAAFRATEALSRPYQIDLYFVAPDANEYELSDGVGGPVTVTADRDDGRPPFQFHGVVESVRLLNQMRGSALYHAVVVPRLRLLAQSRHSRVFTKKKVPEIIEAVLKDAGFSKKDYELRLRGDYEPELHVCQYQESDLDFLHRWMELEGIYYFFEHGDEAELLVITDDRSAHVPLALSPVRYHPAFGADASAGESLWMFTCEHRALPASLRVTDYDYARPSLNISARADVAKTGVGEVVMHNARFFDPGAAKRYARIRAEEMLTDSVTFEASGTAMYLRAGYVMEVEDHPNPAMNARYLITEARHLGNLERFSPDGESADEVYRVELKAIREDVQFRPRRVTAWPHAYGVEGGTIDGPAKSEYAQIDDQGRYAVKFQFDESDLKDGQASTYVRMAQPHGGGIEGFHFPLRKGTEVMFAFLGGDPDRPVIVGVAPNALTPSPVTRANHTANIIQTGGRNRIEFEDYAGGQRSTVFSPTMNSYLRMGAPNDDVNAYLSTDGNGKIEVGGHVCGPTQLYVTTIGVKDEEVEGTTTETYFGPFETTVTNATDEHYHQKKKETVTGALVETFQTSQRTTVGGDLTETYNSQDTHVTGARRETVRAAVTETYTGPQNTTVTNPTTEDFGGTFTRDVTGVENHIVAGNISRLILGRLKHDNANEKKIESGASAKLILGAVVENFIGGKLEVLNGSIKAETCAGMKVERTALKIEGHLSSEIGVEALDIERKQGKLELAGAKTHAAAGFFLKIANGIASHTGGLIFKN
jgi:type VI secretion system secreted protein VgrG